MFARRAAMVLTLGGCPSDNINDVMQDPRVREALNQMWTDSHEGQPDEHEEGAWVYQCQMSNGDGTYRYYTMVQRWPAFPLQLPGGPR